MRRLGFLALSLVSMAACSMGDPASPTLEQARSSASGGSDPKGLSGCDLSASVSGAAIDACLTAGGAPNACLEGVVGPYLKDHTTVSALAFLQCLEDSDDTIRVACHPVAHAIGRETFTAKGTVDAAFRACDQTCHSGCYHGVMERFLRGDAAANEHISFGELQAKVATACDPKLDFRLRFQCLHGLGHAIAYYTEYDVKASLKLCDSTGDDWSAASCWGGVFMENLTASTPALRDVSPTDYHYPCDKVDTKYKGACYAMQTSRMTEMGLTSAQIIVECGNAGSYEMNCIESMGRDLSNTARFGDPRAVSAVCELGKPEQLKACTRGCVRALADNTWDGRYALAYCKTYLADDAVRYCYDTSLQYLETVYNRTADDLARECGQYAPGVRACLAALGR